MQQEGGLAEVAERRAVRSDCGPFRVVMVTDGAGLTKQLAARSGGAIPMPRPLPGGDHGLTIRGGGGRSRAARACCAAVPIRRSCWAVCAGISVADNLPASRAVTS